MMRALLGLAREGFQSNARSVITSNLNTNYKQLLAAFYLRLITPYFFDIYAEGSSGILRFAELDSFIFVSCIAAYVKYYWKK